MTSWFTSALQTVREKVSENFICYTHNKKKMLTFQSIDALDFVRRDLNEFTTTVKNDTEVYLNKIKTQEVGFENQKIVCFFLQWTDLG